MENQFFECPILNSPYEYPKEHWELDPQGQPTQKVIRSRRPTSFITPIPQPRKRKAKDERQRIVFDEGLGLSSEAQQYDTSQTINELRREVDAWRQLPESANWQVTPETKRLLTYWRHHDFSGVRPFFCQLEAVEIAIWLTEVAPKVGKRGGFFTEYLADANAAANPGLMRLALKLATGAGKTTVMAMLIAWQTVNAVRYPGSKRFTRGFLIVTPGLTIRDRLRVLQPNDPDSYYKSRELIPSDLIPEIGRAKIVITNYHAFRLRERLELSRGGRSLLQGRGEALQTLETEGQMLQRVMPDLMGLKNIMVLNDEAHHCYREKPSGDDEDLKGNDKKEAEKNNVFDIMQGVSIGIFVKKPSGKQKRVYKADLWGSRESKYKTLWESDASSMPWQGVTPQAPFDLFGARDEAIAAEYELGWKITNVMPTNVLGFQTHRDNFAVDFREDVIHKRISALRSNDSTDDQLQEKYKLKNNRDWNISEARHELRRNSAWEGAISRCLYRPFDWRFCYFSDVAMDYPRRELLDNVF